MIRVLERFYSSCLDEQNKEQFGVNSSSGKSVIPLVLAIVTVEILLLLVGTFLWNNYLVKVVTIVKPINSILELLAVSILLKLLLCSCN